MCRPYRFPEHLNPSPAPPEPNAGGGVNTLCGLCPDVDPPMSSVPTVTATKSLLRLGETVTGVWHGVRTSDSLEGHHKQTVGR